MPPAGPPRPRPRKFFFLRWGCLFGQRRRQGRRPVCSLLVLSGNLRGYEFIWSIISSCHRRLKVTRREHWGALGLPAPHGRSLLAGLCCWWLRSASRRRRRKTRHQHSTRPVQSSTKCIEPTEPGRRAACTKSNRWCGGTSGVQNRRGSPL